MFLCFFFLLLLLFSLSGEHNLKRVKDFHAHVHTQKKIRTQGKLGGGGKAEREKCIFLFLKFTSFRARSTEFLFFFLLSLLVRNKGLCKNQSYGTNGSYSKRDYFKNKIKNRNKHQQQWNAIGCSKPALGLSCKNELNKMKSQRFLKTNFESIHHRKSSPLVTIELYGDGGEREAHCREKNCIFSLKACSGGTKKLVSACERETKF